MLKMSVFLLQGMLQEEADAVAALMAAASGDIRSEAALPEEDGSPPGQSCLAYKINDFSLETEGTGAM